jgi:hypothetical protein
MKLGTVVFLGLFGLYVLHERAPIRCDSWIRLARPDCAATPCEPASPVRDARVRELQTELDRLERRGRDLERSLQAVSQSERSLRELASRHGDAAVRDELAEISSGVVRLRDLRDRTEVERVAVNARLQLARAGLDERGERLDPDPEPRASPVDALSAVERDARPRFTSRAR